MTNEQLITKEYLNVELDKMDDVIEHGHVMAGIEIEKIQERLDALEIHVWDAIKVLTNKYHRL